MILRCDNSTSLIISPRTAEVHISNLKSKLQCESVSKEV